MADELAWAAGLFEGEGSICQHRTTTQQGKTYTYSQMCLTMCDEAPVRRFANAIGVGNVTGPHKPNKPNRQDRWTWRAGSRYDVAAGILKLMPWLSLRRIAQATEALDSDTRTLGVAQWEQDQQ